MLRSRSILRTLGLLLFLSRWLGLYPCKRGTDRSRVLTSWSVFLTVMFTGNMVFIAVSSSLSLDRGNTHKYLIASEAFFSLQIASCLVLSIRAAPVIARVLLTMKEVEKTLAEQNIPIVYNGTGIAADFLFRATALSLIFTMRLLYTHHRATRGIELLSMVVLSTAELVNVAILKCFKQALEHLNRHLNRRNLQFIINMEYVIVEASKSYRGVVEMRLLFRIGTTYAITTIDLFFLLTIIGVSTGPGVIYHALVTPYKLYEVFVTAAVIQSFTRKTEDIRTSLFGLVLSDDSDKLSHDGKVKAHLRMRNSVPFSACGFFPLDATLIHAILASIANYLTILYQFGRDQSPPLTDR